MMNSNDQVDFLQRKVSSLEEENAKLKHRVEEVEQELSLNGYVIDEEENITVNKTEIANATDVEIIMFFLLIMFITHNNN